MAHVNDPLFDISGLNVYASAMSGEATKFKTITEVTGRSPPDMLIPLRRTN